jgi:DNA-binding response OmpR family regulator
VVDDDAQMLGLVGSLLNRSGYEVLPTPSARHALQIVGSSPPVDLVISDFYMPEMDGGALIREITRISPQSASLLMSGDTLSVAEVPVGVPVLKKPFMAVQLYAAVEAALDRSAQVRSTVRSELELTSKLVEQRRQLSSPLAETVRASRDSRQRRVKEKERIGCCKRMRHLADDFSTSARLYAEAVAMFARHTGTISTDEFRRLRDNAKEARQRAEVTRIAFEEHIDSHHCESAD